MKGRSPLTDNHNSEEISVINIPNNGFVPGFHANQRRYKVHDRDRLKRTHTKRSLQWLFMVIIFIQASIEY